ncbi:hypothetical protein PMSD_28075 [Paenibacillus macquariensis subsp. defensor]|nr:hypothetical protein PMSD_28075 [Paenibacillus macquariensis subsp. defensor]
MGLSSFNRARRIAAEKLLEENKEKSLDKMNLGELKEYAIENGIDLGEATKKPDILATIIRLQDGEPNGESIDPQDGDTQNGEPQEGELDGDS